MILVKSPSFKLPSNSKDFLKNGVNKKRMIEIFKDVNVSQWQHVLSKPQGDMFYFSMDGICYALTADGVRICQEPSSNQEEADTKMILHVNMPSSPMK